MDFESIRKNGDLLFESIRGSHLFGLATETSDVDTFGVFCGPDDWFLGMGNNMTSMVKSEKNDDYWDELGKYFFELGKSNPEALVSLFTPDKHILHFDPILQPLWDIKGQLLTKECFKSFSGYAYSQIKKAKGLKKAINTDPSEVKERKSPLHFCQVPVGIGTWNLIKWLGDKGLKQEYCGISRLANTNECYSLYYDWGLAEENGENIPNEYVGRNAIGYRGILSTTDPLSSQLRLSSIPKGETPLVWFQFNSNAYTAHCIDYKRYWDWVKNRNTERFKLNEGHKYDCYSSATTLFLTKKNGWKFYNSINDDEELACFDKDGNLVFSPILSRTEYEPEDGGDICILEYDDPDEDINFSVTTNHRLYLRKEGEKDYKFIPAGEWLISSGNYYQLKNLKPNEEDLKSWTDNEIEFFALVLLNGYILRLRDIKDFELAIMFEMNTEVHSYLVKTRIEELLKSLVNYDEIKFKNINLTLTDQHTYTIHYGSSLPKHISKIIKEFFNITEDSWLVSDITKFSTRQLKVLLNSLNKYYKDDPTCLIKLNKNYWSIKGLFTFGHPESPLVIIINTLILSCRLKGIDLKFKDSNLFGNYFPLNNEVPIKKLCCTERWITNRDARSKVVCFETKLGTLVTRGISIGRLNYNHEYQIKPNLSFHGNSKNISHCVRIFTMAKEIATGKGMILDRTDIDRDFLLSIKNHSLSYNEVMEYVENLRDEMEESFIISTLPSEPDKELLDRLLIDIRKKHYARKKI